MRLNNIHFTRFPFVMLTALMAFVIVFSVNSLYAHTLGQSYIYLQIYDNKVTGRFEIELSDLNKALNLETSGTPVTKANLADRTSEVYDYYLKNVQFSDGTGSLPIRFTGVDTMGAGKVVYALLNFSLIEVHSPPDTLDVDYSVMFDVDSAHLAFLIIEQYWKANIYNNESSISLSFSPKERRQQLNIVDYSVFHGFMGIVKLGIKHIWMGIDHILFLVALILPAAMFRRENYWQPVTEFRPAIIYVVKIVTLFTIAHSITLSLAALNVIELPSRLVESVIALSIAIAALDILFPIFHRKIGWVVFFFGLFHGFGFASVLSHLGLLGEYMALSLFGFNLGVEIGQVVVICFIFPVLYVIRQYDFYPKAIMRFGAVALILMAVVWFVERAFLEKPFAKVLVASWSFLKG
jgi:hypothetical protein